MPRKSVETPRARLPIPKGTRQKFPPKAKRGKKQKARRVASAPEVVSEPVYEPLDPEHKKAMAKWREGLIAENMANKKP